MIFFVMWLGHNTIGTFFCKTKNITPETIQSPSTSLGTVILPKTQRGKKAGGERPFKIQMA